MKSITYILVTVSIIGILFTAFPISISGQNQTIKIHCIDNVSNIELFNESSEIIKNRLESFGIKSFGIAVLENQSSINIDFKENIEISEIESLLTSKARFEFFETFDRSEIIDKLYKNDTIFSLLNIPIKGKELKKINSSAILGFSYGNNKSSVESYLCSRQISDPTFNKINFAWSYSSNDNCELFLLKKISIFDGRYVKECVGKYYPDSDKADIIITFTPDGAKTWQEMTKQNIGKSIAIVMDNKVYHAPKVAFEIETGKCRITGNFSANEVNKLLSLINNKELPLNFEVIN
jgi:SecD/SecF fusion protein